MQVYVTYAVDETTQNDFFTCTHAAAQVFADGRGHVALTNGRNALGKPVHSVLYAKVWRIEKRETESEK